MKFFFHGVGCHCCKHLPRPTLAPSSLHLSVFVQKLRCIRIPPLGSKSFKLRLLCSLRSFFTNASIDYSDGACFFLSLSSQNRSLSDRHYLFIKVHNGNTDFAPLPFCLQGSQPGSRLRSTGSTIPLGSLRSHTVRFDLPRYAGLYCLTIFC